MALGEAIGPLLAVFISNRITPHSMFMVSAIIGIVVALIAAIFLRGMRQTDNVSKSAQPSQCVPDAIDSGRELVAM